MEWEEGEWIVYISTEGCTVRVTLDEFAKSGPCQVMVDKAVDDLYCTLEQGTPSEIRRLDEKLLRKRERLPKRLQPPVPRNRKLS
jgi:hypothetical protein